MVLIIIAKKTQVVVDNIAKRENFSLKKWPFRHHII